MNSISKILFLTTILLSAGYWAATILSVVAVSLTMATGIFKAAAPLGGLIKFSKSEDSADIPDSEIAWMSDTEAEELLGSLVNMCLSFLCITSMIIFFVSPTIMGWMYDLIYNFHIDLGSFSAFLAPLTTPFEVIVYPSIVMGIIYVLCIKPINNLAAKIAKYAPRCIIREIVSMANVAHKFAEEKRKNDSANS